MSRKASTISITGHFGTVYVRPLRGFKYGLFREVGILTRTGAQFTEVKPSTRFQTLADACSQAGIWVQYGIPEVQG